MKNQILNFIKERFPIDNNWLTGNCYFFAKILEARFQGIIFYDVVNGHFIVKIQDGYYDYSGQINVDLTHIIRWKTFKRYDPVQYERILRDCIR